MPASNETVSNRPLSGDELRQILLRDLDSMLQGDGMFTAQIGYGRVAYEIQVKVHTGNPVYPEHVVLAQSRNAARDEKDPKRVAVEGPPPLKEKLDAKGDPDGGLDEGLVVGLSRARNIDSPNLARVEHGLGVKITRRDGQTGEYKDETVKYDNSGLTEKTEVVDKDVTDKVAKEWGI